MRGELLRHVVIWALLLGLGVGLSTTSRALETPAEGHEWVVEGGIPELTFARIWGGPQARGWVQFSQDYALLGPTVGGGYETTSFAGGVHDLRLSAEAELWSAFRDVASVGLRSSLRLDNVWRAGWARMLAGPRLDGAVAVAGLEDAYLAPGATFAVGVELPSTSGDALGIWLNTSAGYAVGGFGGGAVRGRFWLGVGF